MFWKDFNKYKPKKDGWYLCSITFGNKNFNQSYVMCLYWYAEKQAFKDNIRQYVFETYNVFNFAGERMYTERLCDRADNATAWRKLPKYYVKGAKRKIKYEVDNG